MPRRIASSTTPATATASARAPRGTLRLAHGWVWAAAGAVCGTLLALACFAPARWLAAAVERASGGHLQLAAPRGTVWRGSAQLVLTGGAGSRDAAALPERVQWTLRPRWTGAALSLQAACCTPQPLEVLAAPRWGGVRLAVADGGSRWPAALLTGLGTPWNTLQPAGDLALSTHALVADIAQGRLALSGSAQLEALALSSALSPLRPLGSYRVQLQGGAVPQLTLSTIEGALRLAGQGQIASGRLRFQGEASAAPGYEAALANLLNVTGRRDGAQSRFSVG